MISFLSTKLCRTCRTYSSSIALVKARMVPEMQLVITENKRIINTVSKATNSQFSHLVKSLQEFQQLVNATITNIIEDRGGSNQEDNEELSDDSEDDDAVPVTPKKRRN